MGLKHLDSPACYTPGGPGGTLKIREARGPRAVLGTALLWILGRAVAQKDKRAGPALWERLGFTL